VRAGQAGVEALFQHRQNTASTPHQHHLAQRDFAEEGLGLRAVLKVLEGSHAWAHATRQAHASEHREAGRQGNVDVQADV
jgi:hypothetical protein